MLDLLGLGSPEGDPQQGTPGRIPPPPGTTPAPLPPAPVVLPDLMDGWDENEEADRSQVLFSILLLVQKLPCI